MARYHHVIMRLYTVCIIAVFPNPRGCGPKQDAPVLFPQIVSSAVFQTANLIPCSPSPHKLQRGAIYKQWRREYRGITSHSIAHYAFTKTDINAVSSMDTACHALLLHINFKQKKRQNILLNFKNQLYAVGKQMSIKSTNSKADSALQCHLS